MKPEFAQYSYCPDGPILFFRRVPAADVCPRVVEAFAETAFFEETGFEMSNLPVDKVGSLMDYADNGIGGVLCRPVLDTSSVGPI